MTTTRTEPPRKVDGDEAIFEHAKAGRQRLDLPARITAGKDEDGFLILRDGKSHTVIATCPPEHYVEMVAGHFRARPHLLIALLNALGGIVISLTADPTVNREHDA